MFVDTLGVAVYTTDEAGHISYFNDAAARLWGRRPELGEDFCGSWRLFWPDGRPMAHDECPMAIALREDRPVRGWTAVAERPDGTRVDFEPYPSPLHDAEGRLVGGVNVLVDVTTRRRIEEDLRSASEALAISNSVKDEFLGLVSHELRTPVTTIYGNAQLLRDRGTALSEEQRAGMIADVAEDSERLLSIVENILQFSRFQAGAHEPLEPQVLMHVVDQEIAAFARRHPDRTVRLTLAPGRHVVVEADRTHLVLLLQNLLINAHKYGGDSGAPIDVEVRAMAGEATVLVLDRGIGLGEGDHEILFAPFYRSKDAQRAASGLGLGLSVCQRIVSAFGGRIWARPRDGGGSEFGFAIPLAPEPDEIGDGPIAEG